MSQNKVKPVTRLKHGVAILPTVKHDLKEMENDVMWKPISRRAAVMSRSIRIPE